MAEGLAEIKAMQTAFEALEPLDEDGRRRTVMWLVDALGMSPTVRASGTLMGRAPETLAPVTSVGSVVAAMTRNGASTPKEFMAQKRPTNAQERVACLGYFLTHYRDIPKFKTANITALNTEAAGPRMTHASRDVDNAERHGGYVVGAGNQTKQMTSRGEALVVALPDREAVKAALGEHPFKRRRSTSTKKAATNKVDAGDD